MADFYACNPVCKWFGETFVLQNQDATKLEIRHDELTVTVFGHNLIAGIDLRDKDHVRAVIEALQRNLGRDA